MSGARVVIVGVSGGGSHIGPQLAREGIGEIIVIDCGRVKESHRHRWMGLTKLDVFFKRRKVDIARREILKAGLGTRCRRINAKVPDPETIEALKSADIIIVSVDNLHARREIQEIAARFMIPMIDIGMMIREIESPGSGPRIAIGGNVITAIPGGFCLWCARFLSDAKIAAELNPMGYFETREGDAQVVTFNGLLASQACTEVLQLLTGFGGTSIRELDLMTDVATGSMRGYRKLDGVRGTLADWGARRRPDCFHCNDIFGHGQVVWKSVG